VDGRVEEVDEANAHLFRERGRQILATDETQSEQDRRKRLLGALRLLDRLLEVVARKHVSVDERLAESSRLVGQHGCSPPQKPWTL